MSSGPIVVAKLGGSLLDWPDWPTRLRATLDGLGSGRVVVVVGGGRIVDAVRELDRIHSLGQERSHHLALSAMGTTARVAAALLPGATVVGEPGRLVDAWAAGLVPIVDPAPYLGEIEAPTPVLPLTWDVTSDSIAARVAGHLGAAELVLLKSTALPAGLARFDPEAGPDWSAAAALGLVDPEFPRLAAAIPRVRFVGLRDR